MKLKIQHEELTGLMTQLCQLCHKSNASNLASLKNVVENSAFHKGKSRHEGSVNKILINISKKSLG